MLSWMYDNKIDKNAHGMEHHDINVVFKSMFLAVPPSWEAHPAAFESDPAASQTLLATSQTLPTASEALPVMYLFSTPYYGKTWF